MSRSINVHKTLSFFSKLVGFVNLFLVIVLLASCGTDVKEINNNISFSSSNIKDSITITDVGTDVELINYFGNEKVKFPLPYNTMGKIQVGKHSSAYLTFLESGRNIEIEAFADSSITTNRVVDSLLNYLSANSLDFLNENMDFIFTTDNLDSIVQMFDTYKLEREQMILDHSNRLSASEIEILKFYNSTRLYGFLLFYGLVPKKINAENGFYDFTERIEFSANFLKSAPNLYLTTLKIQYSRKVGSLNSLTEFLNYIDENLAGRDISDFMKFVFIKKIIESSQYFESEQKFLNTDTLEAILEQERENKYYHVLERFTDKFFLTQKGKKAIDFRAEKSDGSPFRLGDYSGKVVFIDVWATWCAPCLEARPKVIDMANKFKDNPNLEVLMVSVDDSREKWLSFLNDNIEPSISNVFIKGGMKKDFGRQFNINYIPNYILIDKQGLIVDAYIKEPSSEIEEMIVKELSK